MLELRTPSPSAASDADWPDYPDNSLNIFTPEYVVGGFGGGKVLSYGGIDGRLVIKIEVWYNGDGLRGIRLTYSDGSQGQGGSLAQSYGYLDLAPGEMVTSLLLWGNGRGTRTGRIELTLNTGRSLKVGKDVSGQDTFAAPVGSGILVGFTGRFGSDIDMLGLIFFTEVFSAQLTDVTYQGAPQIGSATGIGLSVLAPYRVGPFDTATKWDFTNTVTRRNTQSWSKSRSMTVSASVTVKASIFDFGASATAGWESTTTEESSTEVSDEKTLSWSIGGDLPANTIITAVAEVRTAQLSLPYQGTFRITLLNGNSFSYGVSGIYTNVLYGFCQARQVPNDGE